MIEALYLFWPVHFGLMGPYTYELPNADGRPLIV